MIILPSQFYSIIVFKIIFADKRLHNKEFEEFNGDSSYGQRDKYRGSYWFQDEEESSWARYLHINAIKSHGEDPKRYEFFEHNAGSIGIHCVAYL